MSSRNFWGQLPAEVGLDTPTEILQEQGEQLAVTTNGEIRGVVIVRPMVTVLEALDEVEDDFLQLNFYLEVPDLHDYRHLFLEIKQRHFPDVYPLHIHDVINERLESCANVKEFEDALRRLFTTETVQNVIAGLRAASRSNRTAAARD